MNRTELVRKVSALMKDKEIRKPVVFPKQVFHISDDSGNTKSFTVKQTSKSTMYTIEDVEAILEACLDVVKDALKKGEKISIRGFGSLGLHYREARATRHPTTGEYIKVKARYSPKFWFGDDLRLCAKMYELSLNENPGNYMLDYSDIPDDDEYDDYENGGDC